MELDTKPLFYGVVLTLLMSVSVLVLGAVVTRPQPGSARAMAFSAMSSRATMASALSTPQILFEPVGAKKLSVGQNITLTVNLTDVSNLFLWQAVLEYNGSVLEFNDFTIPNNNNVFAGHTFGVYGTEMTATEAPGDYVTTLNWTLMGANLYDDDSVSVSNGILFAAQFTAIREGYSTITLMTYANPIHTSIPATAADSTYYSFVWDSNLAEYNDFQTMGCTVISEVSNRPPSVPSVPQGLNMVKLGDTAHVNSSATDPDGDDVSITFNWGDGTEDTYGPTKSGTNLQGSHVYAHAGVFEVTAKASDIHGAESDWSPPLEVTVKVPTSISVSLSSSTSYIGFKVEVQGNLTCNNVGLSGAPILLSYSVTGGESWSDITLTNTDSDGNYSAMWIPSATGNYIVRALYSGNATYAEETATINLAVTIFQEQNVFSVISNSTVSSLAFNSTSKELSFNVTGPSGTTGYVNVYIAKTLVDNIADVKVYLDSNQLNYTAASSDDSWAIHLTYTHSTHRVTISLVTISPPFAETPLGKALIYGLITATFIIAAITALMIFRRRKKVRSVT